MCENRIGQELHHVDKGHVHVNVRSRCNVLFDEVREYCVLPRLKITTASPRTTAAKDQDNSGMENYYTGKDSKPETLKSFLEKVSLKP